MPDPLLTTLQQATAGLQFPSEPAAPLEPFVWEGDALTVLDSLQAVSARLEDLSCSQTGTDGNTALVNCTGKIILTYDTEDQEIDLSVFTYEVIEEGGDWLVCGTR